jgi:OmpR-family two-component system manganese-sensing sensor histidine kinase
MFQATRRRLALWYTAVTAVLLLLFASGFYFYVRTTLVERIDDTLNHVVEVVERSLVLEPTNLSSENDPYQVNLEASFRSKAETVEDDHIDLEWFGPTKELLWSTLSEPLDLPIHANSDGETVRSASDHLLRQITERVQVDRQILGYLRVSHPWFEVTKPTQRLIVDLILGTSLIIALVAAIGWFLSRLAMEPIQESYQHLKQFTADASHELRNPIALIQTNVQVALAGPQLNPQEQRQQLEVVGRLTRRLGRLVDDLLFLARQDSGMVQLHYQPCPLDALLMQVVEEQAILRSGRCRMIEPSISEGRAVLTAIAEAKDITLMLDLGESIELPDNDPFTLQGDYDQLVRLFTNLVSNAIQHTPPGGKVALTLRLLSRSGTSYLQVKVSDSGIGIPQSALPHLFDRFYRVDSARIPNSDVWLNSPTTATGSGLGLAIARAIVENHQGQIQVESALNQGTTFTVLLPQHIPNKRVMMAQETRA